MNAAEEYAWRRQISEREAEGAYRAIEGYYDCRWCDGWGTITTHRTGMYPEGTREDGARYWSRLDTERCSHCNGTGLRLLP